MTYISLICATKGRRQELAHLLESLCSQNYKCFEVIIVDQNQVGFLNEIIAKYGDFIRINHLRWQGKGASAARNYGLQFAQGEIIGFPDDDCTYPESFLANIVIRLSSDEADVICGKCIDLATRKDSAGRYNKVSRRLTLLNLWTRHILVTMFFKKEVLVAVGGFDEELGAGNYFGSGEETDLLLRTMYLNFNAYYDAELFAYHPDPPQSLSRAYSYGLGWGALHKKHDKHNWVLFLIYVYSLVRCKGGCVLGLIKGDLPKAKYYFNSFKGRISGWIQYRKCCNRQ